MRHLQHVRHDRELRDRRFRPVRYYVRHQGVLLRVDRLSYPSKGDVESTVLVQDHDRASRPWRVRARDLMQG